MKLFVYILLFFSFSLFSQQKNDAVFSLKPALGMNACQIHGDNYNGFHKIGLFAGAAVNIKLSTRASIDLGFYFSQKGARHVPNPQKGDFNFYFLNLNYIDLPLLLNYQLNKDYFITLGPSVGYLADYYEEINYINYTGSYHFNSLDYGVNFGLGKKIKEKFIVEVRTSNSVTAIRPYGNFVNNVFYPNPVARFFNRGFYNNILTLFVAYKINLKKKTSEQSK